MKINELLKEGWGADEITPYGNGYTVWHKNQSRVPNEGNYWVYKTPDEFKDWDDSMKLDLEKAIKSSEPIAKVNSMSDASKVMKGQSVEEGDVIPFEKPESKLKKSLDAWQKNRKQQKAADIARLSDEVIDYYKELKGQGYSHNDAVDVISGDNDIDEYDINKILQAAGISLDERTQDDWNKMSDIDAKKAALQDIQMDPQTDKDPELKKELANRKAELDKEIERLLNLAGVQESATAGATSSGNIASVANPQLSPGSARGKKSYTGDPWGGKSGTKSPAQPKAKQPKNKDGTAKNGLDMKANIFGEGNPLKR